jgi:DNA-binding protein YbaB
MTDPDQLTADYEDKVAQAQQRAERIRDGLTALRVTERTQDGRVSVTVNASGNLVDLRLADGPQGKAGPELAQDIMRTIHRAQSHLADAVLAGLGEVAGPETLAELENQYRTTYPAPAEDAAERRRRTLRLGAELADEAAQQARRERPARDDTDTDYGDRNLLR